MASTDITTLPGWVDAKDITALLDSGALTITQALVYKLGCDTIVQITYSDASVSYIKMEQGRIKIGGADNTFTTGTEILWEA